MALERSQAVTFPAARPQHAKWPTRHENTQPAGKDLYRICTNCIMDTTAPGIVFDAQGRCEYCHNFYRNISPNWHPNEAGQGMFARIAATIRRDGRDREHDCVIGVSGGADSSYATYLAKERFGLRPLVVHVDAGWNSQQAVGNIEKLVDGLRLDLHTEVIDWREMQDLQAAFFRAQVPDQDIPQDLAFFSALYGFAARNRHRYILTGSNISTECIREPTAWGSYYATDLTYVRDIHKRFGQRPLRKFPAVDIFTYKLAYRYLNGLRVVKPLDYAPYVREKAMRELGERFGWQPFERKHGESRFTRFFESYWLPMKFGYDKRRAHFSSLILTSQMTREEALTRIAKPEYDEHTMRIDFEYVANKLDLGVEGLQAIFEGRNRTYRDYRNKMKLITLGRVAVQAMGQEKRLFR